MREVRCYTRKMVAGQRKLSIRVTIAARPIIRRTGPPAVGSCSFDVEDRLVYITDNPAIREFTWHDVMTDGSLSQQSHQGFWNRGEGVRRGPSE